ncbi:MAG: membrane flavodoxin oxidoreductase [uncultured bacterium]|uniref:Membrane flavodoxin oxidoreductase n=1 Tax=Candidatus Wolfebacteria bacterium GW2011_GWE2_44_13 TaxID=1619017 RepID=A0A0G1H906_9BACT|nr:MAG: membrane flavodoxin oxidoreductase [uncultured bacterium]KKT43856.1 MAG: Membrane flavodoxin oxidoreductase [Candidatus Wolfebacteria bacterium GW2011_GWE2_44_13]
MLVQKMKGLSGWFIVGALSVSPLFIWATIQPLSERFATFTTTLTSIGQMLGLVGMAMFALNLILSTRHPILERFFNGMNRVYLAHHTFGAIAFSLLLFHPIFLALKFAFVASPRDAALFLLSTNPPILWGIFALLSMMLFLVLTFFVSFAYDKWRITHKFLAASFILASIHTLIIYSDTQVSSLLYWYMVFFVVLGLIPIIYRTVAPKLFVSYIEYIVDEVRPMDEHTVEIFMKPVFKPFTYKAGQFIFISFKTEIVGDEFHPFSIVSSPDEPRLAIAVKTLGDHTGKFKLIAKNTVAKIEGPFGVFSNERAPGKNQLWIAGGIGITPFIGMAKAIIDPAYRIKIYYCVANKTEAVFLEELIAVAQKNPNITIATFCSNERGYISADALQAMGEDIFANEILICGPVPLMHSLKKQLAAKGVSRAHIHTEEFTLR